jgi:hypothetical protein
MYHSVKQPLVETALGSNREILPFREVLLPSESCKILPIFVNEKLFIGDRVDKFFLGITWR